MNPFYLMTVLYLAIAMFVALDVALVNFNLVPMFVGFRWLRVHFITLGALTELLFGVLPLLVAARHKLPRPNLRLDIWLLLNGGLIGLIVGIPMVNAAIITFSGTLIFIAAALLALQLYRLTSNSADTQTVKGMSGRWFYITGLVYLLLGILIGTGLWQPWLRWFYIKVPIEVHIHANNWGFMSLVFAGLLIDFYPRFSGHQLAWSQSVKPIFWMMTLGALGLVLSPWIQSDYFAVIGIILHLGATGWLLANIIKPIMDTKQGWHVGLMHIVTSYIWIVTPVLMAPLIIFKVANFPGAGIEQNAPQALIYGWVLQFSYAFVPMALRTVLYRDERVELGGNWLSLITVHLGAVLLWVGIFVMDARIMLHGIAYTLWFVSMLPILYELWQIIHEKLEQDTISTIAESRN